MPIREDLLNQKLNKVFAIEVIPSAATLEHLLFGNKAVTPRVKRIIYHNPATIVFWEDGTKTVVKCMEGEKYEKYAGFCAALAKKMYGSTTRAKKIAQSKE